MVVTAADAGYTFISDEFVWKVTPLLLATLCFTFICGYLSNYIGGIYFVVPFLTYYVGQKLSFALRKRLRNFETSAEDSRCKVTAAADAAAAGAAAANAAIAAVAAAAAAVVAVAAADNGNDDAIVGVFCQQPLSGATG